jgi:hypothetical protein
MDLHFRLNAREIGGIDVAAKATTGERRQCVAKAFNFGCAKPHAEARFSTD